MPTPEVPKKRGRPKRTPEEKAAHEALHPPAYKRFQGIYFRSVDINRADELIYLGKRSRKTPTRLGLTMLVRAGLLLLEREMEKGEQHFVDVINASDAEGRVVEESP